MMLRSTLTAAACAFLCWVLPCGQSAHAGLISFDPTGAGVASAQQIGGLDFSIGNTLATGLVNAPVGGTFDVYYQSILSGLIMPTGVTVAPPGLNSTYQITAVSRLTAIVTSISTVGGSTTETFSLASTQVNPFFELWYNTALSANNLAGTGFTSGTLIFRGTANSLTSNIQTTTGAPTAFDQFGTSYPGITSVTANGSAQTALTPSMTNSSFFVTPVSGASFNASMIDPFREVDPSLQFNAVPNGGTFVMPNIGTVNGTTGPDWQFQADSNMSFTGVPEPASIGLFALVGLVLWPRRRSSDR